jgi:flagellar FliJ protein
MKRSQRLEMVQNVVDDLERRKAEALALSERRVVEGEAKLAELEAYLASYVRGFAARAQAGMDGIMARDYQAFLDRLEEAVRQQHQALARSRAQRDGERRTWQGAAQRAEAVGQIVKRFQTEEGRAEDQREQAESDERSLQAWTYGVVARGT